MNAYLILCYIRHTDASNSQLASTKLWKEKAVRMPEICLLTHTVDSFSVTKACQFIVYSSASQGDCFVVSTIEPEPRE